MATILLATRSGRREDTTPKLEGLVKHEKRVLNQISTMVDGPSARVPYNQNPDRPSPSLSPSLARGLDDLARMIHGGILPQAKVRLRCPRWDP